MGPGARSYCVRKVNAKLPDGTHYYFGSRRKGTREARFQNGRILGAIPAHFCNVSGAEYYQVIQGNPRSPRGFPTPGQPRGK
jgi:hypothetical protein